jgi:hypothetical protein
LGFAEESGQSMDQRDALIKDLDGEYENLYAVLVMSLGDAEKLRPVFDGWSVKDVLAHVAAWLREGARGLEGVAEGRQAVLESLDDEVDARNARFVEQWRVASVQEVETELHLAKDAFVRAVRALPPERFAEGEPARHIVLEEGIDHFKEHAQQTYEWKEREEAGRPVPPGMPREAIG